MQVKLRGVVGAGTAATVAMTIWYLLIQVTGYEIGYAVWGLGVLTGLGARILACAGDKVLGIILIPWREHRL